MLWGSGSLTRSLPRFFLACLLYQLSLSTTSHLCKWLQPFPYILCLAFLARLLSKIFNFMPLKNKGTFQVRVYTPNVYPTYRHTRRQRIGNVQVIWEALLPVAEQVRSFRTAWRTALLRNFISFYHQAYRAAVWRSRHNFLYIGTELTRLTLGVLA
jgi:hypothetical protein